MSYWITYLEPDRLLVDIFMLEFRLPLSYSIGIYVVGRKRHCTMNIHRSAFFSLESDTILFNSSSIS